MPASITDASPPDWVRMGYDVLRPPGEKGVINPAPVPVVQIAVRHPLAPALPDAPNTVRRMGMVDTGASVTAVPLWAVQDMGIAVDMEGRRPSFGAGGGFDSYRIRVGIHVRIGGRWLDIGVVRAVSPDTESSRRRSAHLPFLLGRDGFLDKFSVCFDERDSAMWIRGAGCGGGPRRA